MKKNVEMSNMVQKYQQLCKKTISFNFECMKMQVFSLWRKFVQNFWGFKRQIKLSLDNLNRKRDALVAAVPKLEYVTVYK